MRIKEIQVKNFKRFDDLTIRGIGNAKLVILVGANGSGKSSLLEACNTWHKQRKYSIFEDTYHLKDRTNKHHHIQIDFNKGLDGLDTNKIMHFRSAYRNEADFTIQNFQRLGKPNEHLELRRMIDNDVSISKNFQRLVGMSLEELFGNTSPDIKAKEVREKLIGKIQKSMKNIFEDLYLNGLKNPFEDGTFFFKKGKVDSFHYKNLSAGEKSAFDLLLDLVLKIEYFDDSVIFIDEPETHMHTTLQAKLMEEIYNLIPEQNQLWIATHSLGILQKAKELIANQKGDIAILDFSNMDFDEPTILEPTRLDRVIWERFLSLTIGEISNFIAPEAIVFCEGSLEGKKRWNFDASIYNKIFQKKYPNVTFISGGNCEDLLKDNHSGFLLLKELLENTKIFKLLDLDLQSDEEVRENEKKGLIILKRRHLETYLLDEEILRKFCEDKQLPDIDNILAQCEQYKRECQDNPKDAKGKIYNLLKTELIKAGQEPKIGSNQDAFLSTCLYAYVTEDTQIYKELESVIFEKIKNRVK